MFEPAERAIYSGRRRLKRGRGWRGAVGMEIAMTLPERIEPIERVETAACGRGHACLSAAAVHAAIPILKS